MKRWQKIVLSLLSTYAVVIIFGTIAALTLLPNPSSITGLLKRKTQAASPNAQRVSSTTSIPNSPDTSSPPSNLTPEQSAALELQKMSHEEISRLVASKFVERYIEEPRFQSRVCENLTDSAPPFQNTQEFASQINGPLLGLSKRSATTEAVMMPIEYTLKNEAVQNLVREARNAANRGDSSFYQKAQFYGLAATATASILGSRGRWESVSGHAYRLYAIARATALKPALLQDPEVSELCRGIENAVVADLPRDIDFDQDRLLKVLSRHGVTPDQIGYDPNISTAIKISGGANGLRVHTPWLDRVLNSNPPK